MLRHLEGWGRRIRRISPASRSTFSTVLIHDTVVLEQHIREGRFQRSLALITAFSSLLSGLEVTYEHYRGSYSQQVMYTPVFLSLALFVTGIAAAISRRVARSVLPLVSVLIIIDGVVGFYFHVRGVARKPGGWRVPVMNVIMGPPVFAPLLFAISGYLGVITAFLRPENSSSEGISAGEGRFSALLSLVPKGISHEGIVLEQHIREGRFQKNLAAAAGISAFFSTAEALYSHYENNFRYRKLQWSPLLLGPFLVVAGLGTVPKAWIGRTLLPLASVLALLDGAIGFYVHARGIVRRPGGLKLPIYNLIYGPPIFAPLLFAASGFMGLLASLLRRADS
jgi:hypothetical protein